MRSFARTPVPLLLLALAACSSDSDETVPPTMTLGPRAGFAAGQMSCVEERLGALNFRVVLDEASSDEVRLPFVVSGAATAADYTLLTPSPLVLPAGDTEALVRIAFPDDGFFEVDEDVVIELLTPTGAVLGAARTHTITIKHFEIEPNDDIFQAQTVGSMGQVAPGFGVDLHGTISSDVAQFDTFRFETTEACVVQATVSVTGADTDMRLWYGNEDGDVTHRVNDGDEGEPESGALAIPAGEVFHIILSAAGLESDYTLNLRAVAPAQEGVIGPPRALAGSWQLHRELDDARSGLARFAPRTLERARIHVLDTHGGLRTAEIETRLVD